MTGLTRIVTRAADRDAAHRCPLASFSGHRCAQHRKRFGRRCVISVMSRVEISRSSIDSQRGCRNGSPVSRPRS